MIAMRWPGSLTVVFLLVFWSVAAAQEATLVGTVSDASGAVLPGVTVTAVHVATGNVFAVTTEADGQYRLAIRVGVYKLTAELQGFGTVVQEGIELLVGQRLVVDLKMDVSTVQETVTVTGEAPLVDTSQSKLGGNIDPRQLEALPVNGRNWLDLTMLAPGNRANAVTEAPLPRDNGAFQLNVDGQQVTSIISASSFGQPRYSREAIAEFQFVSNRFDATQGRSMGVQVNAVTKSGTNQYSGSMFGYFRDDRFNAKDFIVDRVLPYSNKQFGGTAGGPIQRDRIHFFVAHEREREPQTTTFTSQFPSFNIPDLTGARRENKTTARLDFQFNTRNRATLRADDWSNFLPYTQTGGASNHPSTVSHTERKSDGLYGSFTQVLTDRSVNEIKGGYASFHFDSDGYVDSPRISLRGYNIGSPRNFPQTFGQATWSLRDDLTLFREWRGRHDIKLGGEYLHNLVYAYWASDSRGNIFADRGGLPANLEQLFPVWDDPSTWNLAALSPITSRYRQSFGNYRIYMPEDMFAFWAQDDWQLTDRLTLNLGARYDVSFGSLSEDLSLPPFLNPDERSSDTDNIVPRAGFAYSLAGGKTVIRGGAGKFFAVITNNQSHISRLSAQTAIVGIDNDGRADFASNPFNGRIPTFEEAKRFRQDIRIFDPAAETPYAYQASIGFQRQINETMAFEADYVYTGSRLDYFITNANLSFNPATGANFPFSDISRRPYPDWGTVAQYHSLGRSNYHGLQTAWTKRFANRWQASATYTLSRLWDTGTPYSSTPDNPFDAIEGEYAPSESDQRHRFVFNGIVSLPYEFQVSGLYFYGSGTAFNNVFGGDLRDTGNWSSGRLRQNGTIVPRNSFRGDPLHRVDLRINRRLRIFRSLVADGTFEVFNLFNHENYGSYTLTETNANFGKPTQNSNLAYQPRMLQLGFRVSF
jgi:hypothetical protein